MRPEAPARLARERVVRESALPSCPNLVRLYDAETGKRLLLPCRLRTCAFCGPMHWRPRAMASFHAGIVGPDDEFLAVLLTAPGGGLDVEAWNAGASQRWHNFMTVLRRDYPGLQFGRVAETQSRGAVHYHVLFRGARFIPAGKIRRIAVAVGFGSWVGVKSCAKYKYGARGSVLYYAKYMLKDYRRSSSQDRVVTFSNGWRVNWISRPKPERGRWLWAGRAHNGWRLIGWDYIPQRDAPVKRDVPYWWSRWWQERRAAWCETVALWGDGAPDRAP